MRKLTDDEIKNYLVNNIKQAIVNDCGTALEAYWNKFSKDKISAGFFAIPRLLFPEIDCLGSYTTGEPLCTGLNIKTYLEKIMSQLDGRYSTFASFITFIYRNGLLHQHQPKRFRYKGKELGWWFSIVSPNNPISVQRRYHLIIRNNTLMINMNVFYLDVIQSIDIALEKILKITKNKFQDSYNFQTKPVTKNYLLHNQKRNKCRYIFPRDFKFVEQFR